MKNSETSDDARMYTFTTIDYPNWFFKYVHDFYGLLSCP